MKSIIKPILITGTDQYESRRTINFQENENKKVHLNKKFRIKKFASSSRNKKIEML